MKKNCWELKGCGREKGGRNVVSLGICVAASDKKWHGVNGGSNGGRVCWMVAGTFCEGKVQGTFAEKRETCATCEVFQQIKAEEGAESQAEAATG